MLAVAVLAGCSDAVTREGENPTESSPGGQPEGFTTVTARITEVDGEVCEVCVWLADTPEERARGLMGVTDLGDAAGMVFEFEEPVVGVFYMFQTPTPLSIAWFAPGGEHVGSTDMAPCLDSDAGNCPLYSPGLEYDLALEVFEGDLADLDVGPGARMELVDGTEAERCPIMAGGSAPGSSSVSAPVSAATP
jgi:uncharacterized membrane protein (UPF0127 family)